MLRRLRFRLVVFFFFNDTATTEIYTLSLHDALPISGHWLSSPLALEVRAPVRAAQPRSRRSPAHLTAFCTVALGHEQDRKSTRLNSSHANISYAVFCLKKKKTTILHSVYSTTQRLHR